MVVTIIQRRLIFGWQVEVARPDNTIGATDDIGAEAVDQVRHLHDFHITLLKLLGLDDSRLTYYHGGRFKQLSQFGGEAISELIAHEFIEK